MHKSSAVSAAFSDLVLKTGNTFPSAVAAIKKLGTHLRRDTIIPQWFQASKAAAASDGHAVHC